MEEEIIVLKARILQLELEKREGANKSLPCTDQGHPQSPVQTSLGQNDISQVQLGPFEPELQITPALASLVEHQNFPPPPPPPNTGLATPITPLLQSPQGNSNPTTSDNSPPRPRPPAPAVASPVTPSLHYPSENAIPATSYFPPPPPARPHSTHIPEYQYPTPTSPLSDVASPITPSLQYRPESQIPTTSYYPPPPPPRPHSAHIPEYQSPPPYSFASSSSIQQQQSYAPPPLPPRPQQQPQIQRQDSGYYSNPPSRHSSTFSTATISTCSSPQSMLSPQSTGYSLLSPQTTGQSLRHSVSYGSISPLSPQPAPYFPPPPPDSIARPLSQVKDYFSRSFGRPSPQIPAYQPGISQPAPAPPQNFQGSQGWQWGTASMRPRGEPNYGAPPQGKHGKVLEG